MIDNFYLSVVDDQIRHTAAAPSIGLILCQDRNHIVAEFTLRGVDKPSASGAKKQDNTKSVGERVVGDGDRSLT